MTVSKMIRSGTGGLLGGIQIIHARDDADLNQRRKCENEEELVESRNIKSTGLGDWLVFGGVGEFEGKDSLGSLLVKMLSQRLVIWI